MDDDLSPLAKLAGIGEPDPDFGFARRLRELRDEMAEALGARRTRELWKELSPVKTGRITGERTYADIAPLVGVFDAARAKYDRRKLSDTKLRDQIGKAAHEQWPLKYGASEAGISKSISRALARRAKEADAAKRRDDALRRAILADLLGRDIKSR